jgi:hypothetical protein
LEEGFDVPGVPPGKKQRVLETRFDVPTVPPGKKKCHTGNSTANYNDNIIIDKTPPKLQMPPKCNRLFSP